MAEEVEAVERAVREVVDPRLGHRIGELDLLRSVRRRRGRTEVVVAVLAEGLESTRLLVRRLEEAVAATGAPPAEVRLVELDEEERGELAARLHALGRTALSNSAGGAERHGAAGPAPRPNPFAARGSRTRVLAIGSGKGGVGKSSVTVNLAVALARAGRSVALLDADVYGFSVPSMLGVVEPPLVVGDLLVPPVAHGVRCMSMGFFVAEDQAVIWRGPMLHKALEQFLVDVFWGDPEFLVVDMPPGTGDVALSLAQYLPAAELYVVTTPQPAAQRVAQRAAVMARQLKMPLRGVVENMSWFTGHDGTRYELFGSGGGEALADSLGVALLGRIPFVPAVREAGDAGVPVVVAEPEGEAARAFGELASRIASLGRARVYRSELSVR
jgi:ATP-binding protein involved in chromosome partitioning